jgi:frataxin-like iron-binding protein CyaY
MLQISAISAIEIAIDHLLDIGPPESVLPGEMFLIDLDKGLKIILYKAVAVRRLWISWTINGGRTGHDLSPWRISCRHNVERPFCLLRRIWPVFIPI